MKTTQLIAAFPGTGKTTFFNKVKDQITILDSDSSTFDKSLFPNNYIAHIKSQLGIADVILISSHKVVRDALVQNDLYFTLIYPNKSLKEEYIDRYTTRGNNLLFIKTLEANWNAWIDECESQINCDKVVLETGEYISDVLSKSNMLKSNQPTFYEAFEAGILYATGKLKGNHSIWSDYVSKGFNAYIGKYLK